MSVNRYDEYKQSGRRWLGEIPAHWEIKPLWTLYRRTKRTGFADEELLSVYRDYGVIPKSSRDDNFNKSSDDLSPYQLVEPSDLVINKMKAWQGSVAVSEFRGIVSPAYHVYKCLHEQDSRYLHYLMRSPRYITGYLSISKGIRVNQWDLEPQHHSRMPILLPPLDEQKAISSFLDAETSKIDDLVSEQRRLIELLKEKCQAVIGHAVTKGLNSNARLKPSGFDWIGDIPKHWTMPPVYARYEQMLGKMLDQKKMTGEYPTPYLRNLDLRWDYINVDDLPLMDIRPDEVDRFTVRKGDLLMVEGRELGRSAIWEGDDYKIGFQKALHRLRRRNNTEHVRYFLASSAESVGRFWLGEASQLVI